jgi:hypothetical protein
VVLGLLIRGGAGLGAIADVRGFRAPFSYNRGVGTGRSHGIGTCEWDGAVWPFATSQTLVGLANVLRDYKQSVVRREDYFDAFLAYMRSQHANGSRKSAVFGRSDRRLDPAAGGRV